MTVSKRLKEIRYLLRMSQQQLADELGVSVYRVQNLESGKASTLTKEEIKKLESLSEGRISSVDEMLRLNDEDTSLWFYKYVNAAAGYGSEVIDEAREKYNFTKHALNQLRPHATNLSVVQVEGDSMEPQFRDGDQLFVDTSQNTLDREGIYVVRIRSALLVKCVQIEPRGVRLLSRNTHYRDIVLEGDELSDNSDVAVVGRVLGAVTFNY